MMFMLWIVKVLLALDINLPSLSLRHSTGTDDTNRSEAGLFATACEEENA